MGLIVGSGDLTGEEGAAPHISQFDAMFAVRRTWRVLVFLGFGGVNH